MKIRMLVIILWPVIPLHVHDFGFLIEHVFRAITTTTNEKEEEEKMPNFSSSLVCFAVIFHRSLMADRQTLMEKEILWPF